MKRRSFFQSIAKAAAIVALAPLLAFMAKLEVFSGYDIGVSDSYGLLTEASSFLPPDELIAIFESGEKWASQDQYFKELRALKTFRPALYNVVLQSLRHG